MTFYTGFHQKSLAFFGRLFDISHIAPEFRSFQSKQRLLNSILKVFARTAMHFTFVLFHFEELRRRNYWGAKLRDVERPWMCSALKIIHARGPRIPGMPNSDIKRYSRLDWLSSFMINQWERFYFYPVIILGYFLPIPLNVLAWTLAENNPERNKILGQVSLGSVL